MRFERSTRVRLLTRLLWATACAVFLVLQAAGVATSAPTRDIREAGTLDLRLPKDAKLSDRANGDLMVDSQNRVAMQLITIQSGAQYVLRTWSLDTGALLKETRKSMSDIGVIARFASPYQSSISSQWLYAIDPAEGVLYVVYQDDFAAPAGSFTGVVAFDERTHAITRKLQRPLVYTGIDPSQIDPTNPTAITCTSSTCQPQTPFLAPSVRGMSVTPSELSGGNPKLLFLVADAGNPPGSERNFSVTYLVQWDGITGKQNFIYRVQSCANAQLPQGSAFQLAVFQARLSSGIYIGCATSGGTGQVVRVDLDLNGQPSAESSFPGPQNMIDVVADSESDHLLLKVSSAQAGDSWWVFDGSVTPPGYTGVIGISDEQPATAAGLDPVNGRLYVLAPPSGTGRNRIPGGLLLSDIRRAPVPQALTFEQFSQQAIGWINVDVDPSTGRRTLYVRRPGTEKLLLLQDDLPQTHDDEISDQDSLTLDVKERSGITDHNFSGSGHGFGLRAIYVRGIGGISPTGPDVQDFRAGSFLPYMLGSPCGAGTRELAIGRVRDASLSNSLNAATATVGDTDSGTVQDAGQPFGRCYPQPQDPSGNDLWTQVTGLPVDAPGWSTVRDQKLPGFSDIDRPTWSLLLQQIETVDPDLARRLNDYPRPLDADIDSIDPNHPTSNTDGDDASEGRSDLDWLAGSTVPFVPVQCSGQQTAQTGTSVKPLERGEPSKRPLTRINAVALPGFDASVRCDEKAAQVAAQAQTTIQKIDPRTKEQAPPAFKQDVPGMGTISVGSVRSSVFLYLDPIRGLVARSESIARDIQIGNDIHIDEASAVAEAAAHGRPGTAGTTFDRFLCGVHVKDQAPDTHVYEPEVTPDLNDLTNNVKDPEGLVDPQGGPEVSKQVDQEGCSGTPTAEQPNSSPIDVINRALGSRGRVSTPNPDGQLSQGSPGGYIASVQKDRLDQISSQTLNGDPSTQVPALELVIYNDDPKLGRARQVYQFAGVDASVTYGIYLLNPPVPDYGVDLPGQLIDYTGGPSYTPPPTVDAPPPPPTGPITMLFSGMTFLFRSPRDALLAAAIWLLLFAPVHLALRRRALKAIT